MSVSHQAHALDATVNNAADYATALTDINTTAFAENTITLTGNVTLTGAPPNVTAGVAIVVKGAVDGNGDPLYKIDGDSQFRALHNFGGAATLALEDLILTNHRNAASEVGGAAYGEHMTGMRNVRFITNHITENGKDLLQGGAVAVNNDFTGTLKDSIFQGNRLAGDANQKEGGAFSAKSFTGNLENTEFTGNQLTGTAATLTGSTQYGGAVSIKEQFTGTMKNVTFENNVMTGKVEARRGGAFATEYFKGNIEDSTFKGNKINNGVISLTDFEHGLGGALYAARFEGNITDTVFEGNITPHAGGAVLISHLTGDIARTKFLDNKSERGGALYLGEIDLLHDHNARIIASTFIGNEAIGTVTASTWHGGNNDVRGPAQGGAIALRNLGVNAQVTVANSVFLNNTALTTRTADQSGGWGGAMIVDVAQDDGRFMVAATDGGAMLFYGNRHNAGDGTNSTGTYNSIHFSNTNNTTTDARTLDFRVHADAGSTVWMFDPLSSQADGLTIIDDETGITHTEANLTANITKTGLGDWVLGGVSDMKSAGTWDIDQGSLRLGTVDYGAGDVAAKVDLSHADSHFNLGKDATLGGSGTVAADTIYIGGVVDPDTWKNDGLKANAIGSGISDADIAAITASQKDEFGEIRFVGDVTWANGSRYEAQVDATGNADRVYFEDGGGTTTVTIEDGSELAVSRTDGSDWQDGESFQLIGKDAGVTLDGEFDITGIPIVLGPKLVDNGSGGYDLELNHDPEAYKDLATTKNQQSVADALGSLDAEHAISKAITDNATARLAFDNLSGEIYGSVRSSLLANNRLRHAAQARMQGLGAQEIAAAQPVMMASASGVPVSAARLNAPSQRLWASTWTYDGKTDGNRNAAKIDQSGIGLALGGDMRVTDQVTVGALFGYEDGKVKNGGNRRSRTDVEAYSLGGYVNAAAGGIDLSGGVIYSHLKFDANRHILVPGLAGKAKAGYKGYKVQAFVEAGKTVAVGEAATVTPYASLTQNWLHTNAVHERGSAAALHVRAQTDSVLQTTVGVRAAYSLPTAAPVAVTANLGWASAFGDTKAKTSNRFGRAGSRFSVAGTRMDKNRALVGVGVQARLAPNTTLSVGYDGQFGSKTKDHSASVQVRIRF